MVINSHPWYFFLWIDGGTKYFFSSKKTFKTQTPKLFFMPGTCWDGFHLTVGLRPWKGDGWAGLIAITGIILCVF